MLELYFNDEDRIASKEVCQLIEEVLQFAAREEQIAEGAEVSITFMSDEEIQEVNREYRGIDAPTDVISFALEEEAEGELLIISTEEMPLMLGDIIISLDTAKRQSEEYNHSFEREMGFLALHGLLHLLGYDHMNEVDEQKMFGRQKAILDAFGLERDS